MNVVSFAFLVFLVLVIFALSDAKQDYQAKYTCYEINREEGIEQVDFCLNVLKNIKGID